MPLINLTIQHGQTQDEPDAVLKERFTTSQRSSGNASTGRQWAAERDRMRLNASGFGYRAAHAPAALCRGRLAHPRDQVYHYPPPKQLMLLSDV